MTIADPFAVPAAPPYADEAASHLVEANGLRHHVLEFGGDAARVPVVLVPGITGAAAAWAFVARALPARLRAYIVDPRGRGLSDHPASGFSLDDYAADLAGVIRALELPTPLVVGHSMGARIAAALDVASPRAARGIVLVDPPLSGPGRPSYPVGLGVYRDLLDAARAERPSVAAIRALEPGLPSDEAAAERIRWLRTCDPVAVESTLRGFHDESFHALYARVTAPALLVRGADSPVVTAAGAADLRALRPDIDIVSVPGAGHLVANDNVAGLCSAIDAFERGLPPDPSHPVSAPHR